MKISIIGAGNVGGLTALRLAESCLGEVVLVDVAKGLAQGKVFDMEDARTLVKLNYSLKGTDDINQIKDSDIVVMTAGLARRPGMTREDLLNKNAAILKDVSLHVKNLAPNAILIIVTNPLDIMTYFALKITGFKSNKVFGMGVTLDGARFANLISKELQVSVTEIDACVIGSHGEGMLPMARFTKVKGISLDELVNDEKSRDLTIKTIDRGKEIVGLLGSGSAYFAPSAAVAELVKVIARDEKKILGVSALVNGQYGISGVCIGLPCRLGKNGIEQIIELDLDQKELKNLQDCAVKLKEQNNSLVI